MALTAADRGWGPAGAPGSTAAADYRKQHIVTITVGGIHLQVRREAAPLFAGFITEIVKHGYDLSGRADDWGYASRYVRGYEAQKVLSNHAWGLAVDLNAQDHPLGKRGTHVPAFVVEEAHRWGLSWGGDYIHRPDEMHFEILLSPKQVEQLVKDITSSGRPPLPTPPHQENDMPAATKTVKVTCSEKTGHGQAVVPGVHKESVLSASCLAGRDGSVAKVGIHPEVSADGFAQVCADVGGPTLVPVEVTCFVAFNPS